MFFCDETLFKPTETRGISNLIGPGPMNTSTAPAHTEGVVRQLGWSRAFVNVNEEITGNIYYVHFGFLRRQTTVVQNLNLTNPPDSQVFPERFV